MLCRPISFNVEHPASRMRMFWMGVQIQGEGKEKLFGKDSRGKLKYLVQVVVFVFRNLSSEEDVKVWRSESFNMIYAMLTTPHQTSWLGCGGLLISPLTNTSGFLLRKCEKKNCQAVKASCAQNFFRWLNELTGNSAMFRKYSTMKAGFWEQSTNLFRLLVLKSFQR